MSDHVTEGNFVRTQVYVDGFNLYYGIRRFRDGRRPKYRWLDISKLCQYYWPNHKFVGFKYFTALVKPRGTDTEKRSRQLAFIRALETISNLRVIRGQFITRPVLLPLVDPRPGKARYVQVYKTEEKGSDVNLATHLVHDAHLDIYDCAVVVSNDSDLLEAIRIVTRELNKFICILNPQESKSIFHSLRNRENISIKQVREGVLAQAQFSETMTDQKGEFHKPPGW